MLNTPIFVLCVQRVEEMEQDFNQTSDEVMAKVAEVEGAKGRADTLFLNVIAFEEKITKDYEDLQGKS